MEKKIIVSLMTILLASCSDFLGDKVYNSATPDTFYEDEKELLSGLNAAYSVFQQANYYDHQIFLIGDMSSDMLDTRWGNQVYNDFIVSSGHEQYKNFWEITWKANNAVNAVIVNSVKTVGSEELKNRIVAEAKFLRALNYFNLIRCYGRVPLILDFTSDMSQNLYPSTSTLDSVYAQIIDDLKYAEQVLPWEYPSSDVGRATRGAAKSLLGKVYLTYAGYRMDPSGVTLEKGDDKYYGLAVAKLKEVVESKQYDLFDDYADVFSNEKENGIEHIFSIQYKQGALGSGGWGGEGSSKQSRWAPAYGITHTAWESYRATPKFYKSFVSNDKRKAVIFLDRFYDSNDILQSYPETLNYPFVKKYIRDMCEGSSPKFTTMSAVDGEENTEVLRYADVLLMYTEALVESTQVIDDTNLWGINEVRKRAGLAAYSNADFADLDSFREALLNEREWELCYEGHAWFDYVRMAKLETRSSRASKRFYYWPIPSLETQKNTNLQQSPGWE